MILTKLLTKFVMYDGATTTPTYWTWQVKVVEKKREICLFKQKKEKLFPQCFIKPLLPVLKTLVHRSQGSYSGPLAHETDNVTTRPPWWLQISEDVIYWIIMVVWKSFNKQQNVRFGQIQRVCG